MDVVKIAEIVAEYLDNRDDIASAEVSEINPPYVTVKVVTQGGLAYVVETRPI